MRAALLIAMREVHERKAVLAAAAVAALLPFASPLIPGVHAAQVADARGVMALILSVGLGAILAVVLGANVVARDLAENRLGFDFARPVGALSIWAGRLGAAVGLTLATMAIVLIPALLAHDRIAIPDRGALDWSESLFVPGAVLLLVGLAHAAGVAFRSRSRWLALDLVGLVIVLLLVASGVRRIHDAFAVGTAIAVATLAGVAAVPALWIASALQVSRGRADVVAGHRAQSIALWSMLFVVALAVVGFSVWFVAVDAGDLLRAWPRPAPDGPWIAVSGPARGRPGLDAHFLLDTGTGRSVRLAHGSLFVRFSRDGRRAAWIGQESPAAPLQVEVVDLGAPGARFDTTSISFTLMMPFRADLSLSGNRLATLQGRNLAIHDLASGRTLTAATLAEVDQPTGNMRVAFVDDRRVRAYAFRDRLVGYELDAESRAVTSWTGPAVGEGYTDVLWSSSHDRVILASQDEGGVVLLDGANGATIRRLGAGGGVPATRCRFLGDGRIALIDGIATETATLRIFSAEGEPLSSIDLGTTGVDARFWLGGEAVPGVLLASRHFQGERREPQLLLVDLASGRMREVAGRGRPVAAMPWIEQDRPTRPGSLAARLVQSGGSVLVVDPDSATLRLLAGPGAEPT